MCNRFSARAIRAVFLFVMLAPALVIGQAREHNGATASPVADAGLAPISIQMESVTTENDNQILGTIRARQLAHGVLFEPAMTGLTPGAHGFHIHEHHNCRPDPAEAQQGADATVIPGGQAGDHWDPGAKGHHAGPWGKGHLGDLPNLHVDGDGLATLPVYAPRIALRDLRGKALVVHEHRDNYSDQPDGKGGSGPAVACGVWLE